MRLGGSLSPAPEVRQLDERTLPALARGCAVLGAGGGDTSVGLLAALQATEAHGPVPLEVLCGEPARI